MKRRITVKRFIAVSVLFVLAASCLVTPSVAKKRAKPVATKLFLHGATVVGENDSFFFYNEAFLPMDKAEPTGSSPSRAGSPTPSSGRTPIAPVTACSRSGRAR